jgi:competence protein ComEA
MNRGHTIIFWIITIGIAVLPFIFVYTKPAATIIADPLPDTPNRHPSGTRVHVIGALQTPGLYTVETGTTLHDLLQSLPLHANVNLSKLNLAAVLRDGQKITIPATQSDATRININLATHQQLVTLPGIGHQTAQKIMDNRLANGPITSIKHLSRLIGHKKARALRNHITF